MQHSQGLNPTQEDIYKWIIDFLQKKSKNHHNADVSGYGYDIYLPKLITEFLIDQGVSKDDARAPSAEAQRLSPQFMNALWEMCLKGIVRLSMTRIESQNAIGLGQGYSLTAEGQEWLIEDTTNTLLASTGRIGELLANHKSQFGEGYFERSQEAVRAYKARAYFASCAMCGAAAESILLALAIAKESGNEKQVLSIYLAAGGRSKLEARLFGAKSAHIRSEIASGLDLLKHWRDAAAHGSATNITEVEANVALLLLLKFAEVVKSRWDELVA